MASRFDQPSEPDLDRYDTRDDAELPEGFGDPDAPVDPIERADYDLLNGIDALEIMAMETDDLEELNAIRKSVQARVRHILTVADHVAFKIDQILEKRR